MLNIVNKLLNTGIEEILKDASLSLELVKTYSTIYVNGSQVKGCQDSKRKYFRQLQINGIEMAQKMEKVIDRTCKPNFKGSLYSTIIYKHINPDLLNDELASFYLLNGILNESHFEILPQSYLENKKVKEIKQDPIQEKPVIGKKEVKTLKTKKK
jgi:hypothetical protein